MQIFTNTALVARRAKMAHAASLGGLFLILGGTGLAMWQPQLASVTLGCLIVGFAISSVGIYNANLWVKKPRPEEVLAQALKRFDDRYRLYNYLLPTSHVLLTPFGLFVFVVRNLDGEFTYRDGKWHQRFSASRALRFFVEPSLGNPLRELEEEIQRIRRLIEPEGEGVPVTGAVVFTHPAATVRAKGAPYPIVVPKRLPRLIQRKKSEHPLLTKEVYRRLISLLEGKRTS